MDLILPDEAATQRAGAALARALPDITRQNLLVGLSGELGSGKTTLARALLRTLGVAGAVRSPTFTLVEPYETGRGTVHHLDLYRLEPGPPGSRASVSGTCGGCRGSCWWNGRSVRAWASAPRISHVGLELAGQGRRILLEAGRRKWAGVARIESSATRRVVRIPLKKLN